MKNFKWDIRVPLVEWIHQQQEANVPRRVKGTVERIVRIEVRRRIGRVQTAIWNKTNGYVGS